MKKKGNNNINIFLCKSILLFIVLLLSELNFAQDSTMQLVAFRRGRTFNFTVNSQISVKHFVIGETYERKTKGKITKITDSTITIYSLINNKSTTVPISSIYRFSRANNSILRWAGFISLGSTIIVAGLEGTGNGYINPQEGTKTNGNLKYFEIPAIIGLAFTYYVIYPGLIGEICKKHFVQYGWQLHTENVKRFKPIFSSYSR